MLQFLNDLDGLEAFIRNASPAKRKELAESVLPVFLNRWAPQPGPQSDAYFSDADELLYGGAAGGGKSDLLLGLAVTKHEKSVIFRAQSTDLVALWTRLQAIEKNPAKSDSNRHIMRLRDKRMVEMGHLGEPGSQASWQGREHDLIGFDEAATLPEQMVNFVTQWLRSTNPAQRKRIVFATNPPIPEFKDGVMTDTAVGDWLLRWFAPWLDPAHDRPAKQGELRWFYMIAEGDRLTTVWVDGPGAYSAATGALVANATSEDINAGKVNVAKSRTFIRSLVKDNVFYRDSGYAEQLSSQPEPLRSMLLLGDFTVKGEDHPFQVIPTQWVLAAQKRWQDRQWDEVAKLRQLVIAADVAQGGADTTVLAPLYETDYFDELVTKPGRATPTGLEVMLMLMMERLDGSMIVLDGDGGWGGSTRDLLAKDHNIEAEMFRAGVCDNTWTPTQTYRYANMRAKMWWEFRLALDPKSGFHICLPPSVRLRAQLVAPQFKVRGKEMLVESKDEIRKRIRSSTDEADAVLMAWQYREQAVAALFNPIDDFIERLNGRGSAAARGKPVELENPLENW